MKRNIVIAIYYHPEAFPPTLNSVNTLSSYFKGVSLVYRPNLHGSWSYPPNVKEIPTGNYISSVNQENSTTWKKVCFFLRFTFQLWWACFHERPSVVLLYDSLALLSYWLIRHFIPNKPFIWYHSHDIAEMDRLNPLSLGAVALKVENRIFPDIGLLTLPASERLIFFPLSGWLGKFIVVPNYPSLRIFLPFHSPKNHLEIVKLVFQGRIDDSHGIEQIIPILATTVKNRKIILVLKGYCEPGYQEKLSRLSRDWNVENDLIFEGFGPYLDVPKLASSCHIGIGIFEKKEVMHLSLGTASNKLYEYAALGLPVIYNAEDHFQKYLGHFSWAFPVQVNTESIRSAIEKIVDQYEYLSFEAIRSFSKELNFEKAFQPVLDFLTGKNLLENPAAGTLN